MTISRDVRAPLHDGRLAGPRKALGGFRTCRRPTHLLRGGLAGERGRRCRQDFPLGRKPMLIGLAVHIAMCGPDLVSVLTFVHIKNVRNPNQGPSMPRGGRRPGAGRPKGVANKRTRKLTEGTAEAVALTEASGGVTPLAHLLAVLRDPESSPARKDSAAATAAPYIHPRLSMTATASVNASANSCRPLEVRIFSVPHGCQIIDGQLVWPDRSEATAAETEFRPYEATPALPALTDQSAAVGPLPVHEAIDDGKVVTLRRRDDAGGQ
jgi:hypothetical protein